MLEDNVPSLLDNYTSALEKRTANAPVRSSPALSVGLSPSSATYHIASTSPSRASAAAGSSTDTGTISGARTARATTATVQLARNNTPFVGKGKATPSRATSQRTSSTRPAPSSSSSDSDSPVERRGKARRLVYGDKEQE
ncbi:hypothetical protein CspHIS471_0203010 [Cutaneotrichosporon sp. HIS471]|nr:hypothetical protein CspHIS471_0203010 [Cutaneotrichosporon sp. HIS471]